MYQTSAERGGDTAVSAWHAFAVTQQRLPGARTFCEAWTRLAAGWQVEMNGDATVQWDAFACEMLGTTAGQPDAFMLTQGDAETGLHRFALFKAGVLSGALLVAPAELAVDRAWLVARLGTPLDPDERFRLLDGRPGGAMRPRGEIICHCCYVGINEINDAIAAGCTSVGRLGEATRAGTNCKRCRPDLARLVIAARTSAADSQAIAGSADHRP